LNIFELTALVGLVSLAAGFLGALTGLGGGVVITPAMVLLLGIDLHYAMGAALISVIATSSGAAAAYVREGFSNIRIGMFLEIATTLGAIVGASLTAMVSIKAIGIVFGIVLLYSAISSFRGKHEDAAPRHAGLADQLRLEGEYPAEGGALKAYVAQRVPAGFGIMFLAGGLSGLLGIGSGAVKVLAMDQAMRLPFKVSTTTSNFMIGVTAAASAGIYIRHGYIMPSLAMPVMLGVLGGSLIGSRILVRARVSTLRMIFAIVIVALGVEMIYSSLTGKL
jgi:uncharacterized membrane protein YfcA